MEEQGKVIESQNASLTEKTKVLQDVQGRCNKLQSEIQEKQRTIQVNF